MLAAEFTRLRLHPAFHRDRFMDGSTYQPLLEQIVEASRLSAACVAALAYWGNENTDRWWLPEIVRFARPFVRASGSTALLNLPLVGATMMFYAAGSAAAAAERFDLLARLFVLRGNKVGGTPKSLAAVLVPSGLADQPRTSLYGCLAELIVKPSVSEARRLTKRFRLLRFFACARKSLQKKGLTNWSRSTR